MLKAAGPLDQSDMVCQDKDLFAEIAVNLVAKAKEILPKQTRVFVTLGNENNWCNFFYDKTVMDDIFESVKKYGDYDAGPIAADLFLSQYNPIYRKIKARFPDVRVGAPDVCNPTFTDILGGHSRWSDYSARIIDKAAGMDFFDYHYGVDPDTVQVIHDTVSQYAQQKRGWPPLRSVDSESGTYTSTCPIDPVSTFTIALGAEQEWFAWLKTPDLTCGWASIDSQGYYDGFGRARAAGMSFAMFRPLKGRYIRSECDTAEVETVASLNRDKVVCVALNNRGEFRDVEFRVSPPKNARFRDLSAKMLWFDAKARKTQYAVFKPAALRSADGLIVKGKFPPFATCALVATLEKSGEPSRVDRQRRYIADKVVQWVETGKDQTFTVKIPKEALAGEKHYLLRVGYEKNTAGSARVDVNGKVSFDLPVFAQTSQWQKFNLMELELDRSALRQDNQVTFSVNPGGSKYVALVMSILTEDKRTANAVSAGAPVITLSTSSPGCVITEEEAKTLPDWYLKKTAAAGQEMPPVMARWSFDQAKDGVVPDLSGYGNDGHLVNGAAFSDGIRGKALQLNGKGACMKVNDSPSLLHVGKDQSYAISIWFKMAGGSPGVLVTKSAPSEDQRIILSVFKGGNGVTEGSDEFPEPAVRFINCSRIGTLWNEARATTSVADGKWHHVVAVRDASEEVSVLYIDGEYAGSGSGWMCAPIDCGEPLYVGASPSGQSFSGLIDEVAIYNGILTPSQVARLYRER